MIGRALATAAFLAAALALACASPQAHAGTYVVNACTVGGTNYDNRSWSLYEPATPAGISADLSCPKAGDPMGLRVAAGARTPDAADQRLVFTAPADTTIAGFRIDRRFTFRNPTPDGLHRYFSYYGVAFNAVGGSGDYANGIRNKLNGVKSWYGYPEGNADLGRSTITQASFPILGGSTAGATRLVIRVGCFTRGSTCGVAAGGAILNQIYGASVTLSDTTTPSLTVAADGLLAGGQRSGSDPVMVTATDNSGIRRVDLIDVTGGGALLVGGEDYDQSAADKVSTDKGATCSSRLVHSCPNLSAETVRPSRLTVGRRSLVVRVTDTGGNVRQEGPFTVDVGTPSDRGARNGTGATDTGTLSARFKGAHSRRTVDFGQRPTVTGRLVNSSGAAVANAEVVVLTRNLGSDQFVQRGRLTTGSDGAFSFRPRSDASRLIQIGWRSHVNDVRFTENAYVTMKVRARASLEAPRSVRLGRRFTLSGRTFGVKPPGGVPVVAQGAAPGGHYTTFADGRTTSSGRFKLHYRFRVAGSRGATFRLRVKVLGRSGWPYEAGRTRTVKVRVR